MSAGNGKAKSVKFILDGKEVEALEGETIWQVAKRLGTDIPHLCIRRSPATAPTAIAAPAWLRLKANACWLRAVSASRQKA